MIIDICNTFFRYDLEKPPTTWCNEFINLKYQYDKLGKKNVAGLFFFTDSIETAIELGKTESQEYKEDGYYLTTCSTSLPIKILDFSNSFKIYQMLCTLTDNNIDVLNDLFKMYDAKCGEQKNTFRLFKDVFDKAENEKDSILKMTLISKLKLDIKECDCVNVSIFGQRLTDFENGKHFKKLLEEKGIEGYRWREFGKNFSYCLFNSDKLTSPTMEFQITSI